MSEYLGTLILAVPFALFIGIPLILNLCEKKESFNPIDNPAEN
ncbi:MAG TPA: hypothetical protein VI981_02190 [Candidatus Paceibacterota bacterium]